MSEPQPAEPQPQVGQPPTPPAAPPEAPPWGSNEQFDPEKAWGLIQGLRADKERLTAREVLTPEQKQQLSEYAALQDASRTEQERQAAELAKWQGEAERWRKTSVASRIEAHAAAMEFAYPADAVAQLDPERYVDAGGVVDDAAIKADLTKVLTERPLWRKPPAEPGARIPAPNPNQGSGTGAPSADPRQEFAAILQAGLNRTQ